MNVTKAAAVVVVVGLLSGCSQAEIVAPDAVSLTRVQNSVEPRAGSDDNGGGLGGVGRSDAGMTSTNTGETVAEDGEQPCENGGGLGGVGVDQSCD
jgi:hypothetical protein